MGERRGTKALELWCRRITDGYPGVNVQNMTTSWRDGLAFCAMIHHFRPDLIDFNSLNKDDVYRNNELAFRTAEQHLGIPALLDAEDMASCSVPDRLSILTYLSQFYQTFGGSSPSRLATNRTTETADERIAPVPESPKQKVGSRLGMRRDPCAACGLPVFLAEKLLIARAPYHRTCFRCARCSNQLTPGNYYETEEGQFCCETCPDEEETDSVRHRYAESAMSGTERETSESRPLSDEEKSERKGVLENAAVPDLISHTSQMRKNFMTSHLLSEKLESTAKDTFASTKDDSDHREETKSRIDSAFPDDDENEEEEEDDDEEEEEEEEEESRSSATDSPDMEESNVERYDVHSALNNLDIKSDKGQRSTAISFHDIGKKRKEDDTKESPGRAGERANPEVKVSLVQKRLQMFETRDKKDYVDRADQGKKRNPVAQDVTMVQGDSWDLSPDVLPANEEEHPEKRLEEDSIIKNIDERKDSFEDVGKQQQEDLKITSSEENFSKNLVRANNEDRLDKSKQLENSSKVKSIERRKENFAKIENERIEENETVEKHYENTMGSSVLTAKGINLSDNVDYPEDLNPFKSDEEDNAVEGKPRTVNSSRNNKVSTNPFDSEDENAEESEPPRPAARSKPEKQGTSVTKRVLVAPQINLNPFWSDEEEEHGSDEERRDITSPGNVPVPKPRTINRTAPEVSVVSRRADLDRGSLYASNSSLTSSDSTTTPGGTTHRKKKPAPQPPVAKELFPSEQRESSIKSCNNALPSYQDSSPRTPRARKSKPAPPPPMPTSTPRHVSIGSGLSFDESPIIKLRGDDRNLNMWEDQKTNKDEANRNRQSLNSVSYIDSSSYTSYSDKSVQGKWKRKKGPAPPRPIPHRRKIKVISMKDVKLELDEIELQQQGLERQGVRLEQLIRDKCESGPRTDDSSLGTEVEELVLELFSLVNEKNELFRRQAELMLLRRQQRLEEEHVEVEYQIRCLMCQPEATKTDFDKQREEALIQRLVEIVERRNEIVECLEMDRRREVEEDRSINKHMGLFAARNKTELSGKDTDSSNAGKTKKGKTKEKVKEKKLKKATKKDADKDVDETEVKLKRHGKRKWF